MRHAVPIAHLETEGEYFHRIDSQLIHAMREHAAREEEHRRMAEISQIGDPRILETLEKLGYTHQTITLLHLVPLVELAWVDSSVSPSERSAIFDLADARGVTADTPAWQQLASWLENRPSPEFFEGTWRQIEAEFDSLPAEERKRREDALIESCTKFAVRTCQQFGWTSRICSSKRKLLEEMTKRFLVRSVAKALDAA
jgi:hypothetical protein